MEEIKENEYIRTKEGIIDKVIIDYRGKCNNPNCNYKHISCKCNYYDEENIIKHSSNILDLLEVGDVITYGEETIFITAFEYEDQLDYFINLYKHESLSIKSILTKEQFALAEYKVKESGEIDDK